MEANFHRNIVRLLTGTTFAQIITLSAAPFLTRLFSPEDFGALAVFTALVGIIAPVSCLRYEQTIILPRNNIEAFINAILSLICLVSFVILIVLILFKFEESILRLTGLESAFGMLILIPLMVLLVGSFMVAQNWLTRMEMFSTLSKVMVLKSSVNVLISISIGAFFYIEEGMIYSLIIAQITCLLFLSRGMDFCSLKKKIKFISVRKIKYCFIRYKKFPLYSSFSILLGNGAWMMPVLLMGYLFSLSFVGLYSLGFKILQIPASAISSAIGQVFIQKSVISYRDGDLSNSLEGIFSHLLTYTILPFVGLGLFAEDLYVFVFGESWGRAGLITQILVPWAFVWFLSSPFTGVFSVLEEQKIQLYWNVINFISRVAAVLLAYYFSDEILAVVLLGIFGFVLYSYKIWLIFNVAKASLVRSLRNVLIDVVVLLLLCLFILFVNYYFEDLLFSLVLSSIAIISGNVYLFRSYFMKNISNKFEVHK